MDIGVFDHLDRNDLPLPDFYEARLRLIERYDQAGFHAYHCAEHHLAPIGMAPSPSVFLAAVAQRTRRLRFGPMVYALPTYDTLRIVEEICMLDQMSGGRLELGFGRGSSPAEIRYFGKDYDDAQRLYQERFDLIIKILSEDKISFAGEAVTFQNLPLQISCLQKPHPPLWYGVHSIDSADRAARRGLNLVSLDTAAETRSYARRYREVWDGERGTAKLPRIGVSRFVVVAATDAAARDVARRAYARWLHSFTYTSRTHNYRIALARPADFDDIQRVGKGVAGSPQTVASFLARELKEAEANYLVVQLAFGDLSPDETMRSLNLFVDQVVPALAQHMTD